MAHSVGSIALRPPHATKFDDFEAVIQTTQLLGIYRAKNFRKGHAQTRFGTNGDTTQRGWKLRFDQPPEAIAAAKGGLEAMVRAAASTHAGRGLRVNAVAPGLTETRLGATVSLRSEAIREASVGIDSLETHQ